MIVPTGHRIIVQPDPIETQTESGIVIAADEKLQKGSMHRGVLVAVGPQAWKAFDKNFSGEPWAKVGDYVIFARYAGKFIEDPVTGEEFTVLNDEDLIAVVNDGPTDVPKNEVQYKVNHHLISK